MIEELLPEIAKQGLVGVFLVIVGIGYFKKDQTLSDLQTERLKDIKEVKDQYVQMTIEVNRTLDKLCSLIKGGGR